MILLQALQQWKDSHAGSMPRNYEEKNQFRKSIHAMKRGGSGADHENFEEAVDMVMKAVKPTTIPDTLQKLFKDSQCEQISSSVSCVRSGRRGNTDQNASLRPSGSCFEPCGTSFSRQTPTKALSFCRSRGLYQT